MSFFELIGYRIPFDSNKIFGQALIKKNFLPLKFGEYSISIEIDSFTEKNNNGMVLWLNFEKKNVSKKLFSMVFHYNYDFILVQTEGVSQFKSQLIKILNTSFEDEDIYFFSMNFYNSQEWAILNHFNNYMLLKLITEDGIETVEGNLRDFKQYPIYSVMIKIKTSGKTYPLTMYLKGFLFPPRIKENDVFEFLNEIKSIM